MQPKSVVPLRIGGGMLALLGIFPLAATIKYSPVVRWVPAAAVEWVVATSALVVVCLIIARRFGDGTDRVIDRGRALLLSASPRDFAGWAALTLLALSLFFTWSCFAGFPP